jgi:RimJ/RimL family protein N-acetyltransferase
MPTLAAHTPRHHAPTASLRPARADDAAAVRRFLQELSATSRRQRFHGYCNPQSPTLALQLCRVDGVRHQAWLAWEGDGDDAKVVGEARFVRAADVDAGLDAAELAIVVADDWQGSGLADALMGQLLHAAALAGVRRLDGDVLDGNVRMQAFMRRHGFEADPFARGEVLRMSRALAARRDGWARTVLMGLAALFLPGSWQARPARAAWTPHRATPTIRWL